MTQDHDHLRTFFHHDLGRVINYSALEALLGMYPKALRQWLRPKNPQGLADHHREKLLRWAMAHGYDENTQYDPLI